MVLEKSSGFAPCVGVRVPEEGSRGYRGSTVMVAVEILREWSQARGMAVTAGMARSRPELVSRAVGTVDGRAEAGLPVTPGVQKSKCEHQILDTGNFLFYFIFFTLLIWVLLGSDCGSAPVISSWSKRVCNLPWISHS